MQEFSDSLKVVKVEADPNPALVEKYKVSQSYTLPICVHKLPYSPKIISAPKKAVLKL